MMIYYESTGLHIQARRLKTRENIVCMDRKKRVKNVQIKIKKVEKRKNVTNLKKRL